MSVETKFVFRYVEETGGLVLFDRICRTLHLLNFLPFSSEQELLFINVHPALLNRVDAHGKVFERIVHSLSVPTDRVVIELEETDLEEPAVLDTALKNFRERGFNIAISDFGKERTDIKRLWQIRPDFVKLHSDILHAAVTDQNVRHVLPKIIDLIQESGCNVVIQGIETREQLEISEGTAAGFRQGFAISRPEYASHWLQQKRPGA